MQGGRRWSASIAAAVWLGVALGSTGCDDPRIGGARLSVTLDAPSDPVVLRSVLVGYASSSDEVVLRNRSRVSTTFTATATGPFEVTDHGALEAGGDAPLHLTFRPVEAGAETGTLSVTVEDTVLTVGLSADAPASCTTSSPCQASEVDPSTGSCVVHERVDGAPCSDACLIEGVCSGGECRGTAVDCTDGDACTRDACSSGAGCIHVPETCAAGADPCQVPTCDPTTGCSLVPVADGTRCGSNDCSTAHVCIAGACVARAAPEGSECGAASPCQPFGVCASGSCSRPAATPLHVAWTYAPAGGISPQLLADERAVYFVESNFHPDTLISDRMLVSLDAATGAVRYRRPLAPWEKWAGNNNLSLGGGQVFDLYGSGDVAAYDAATGVRRWRTDLFAALRPQLSPSPSGYTDLRVLPMLARTEGGLVVVYADAMAFGPNGLSSQYDSVGAFRITLEPGSGAIRTAVKLGELLDATSRPSIDAHGNSYLQAGARLPTGQLDFTTRSFDPMGHERWRGKPFGSDATLGPVIGERIFGWKHTSSSVGPAPLYQLDASSGSVQRELPYGFWNGGNNAFLGRGDVMFFAGVDAIPSSASGACCYQWFLDAFDLTTGTWVSTPWRSGQRWQSPLVLTSRSEALYSSGNADYDPEESGTYATLTAMGADGIRFECALDPGYRATSDPVLVQGRWIAFDQRSRRFVAYDVPGVSASPSGWITNGGSFARDFAERP